MLRKPCFQLSQKDRIAKTFPLQLVQGNEVQRGHEDAREERGKIAEKGGGGWKQIERLTEGDEEGSQKGCGGAFGGGKGLLPWQRARTQSAPLPSLSLYRLVSETRPPSRNLSLAFSHVRVPTIFSRPSTPEKEALRKSCVA